MEYVLWEKNRDKRKQLAWFVIVTAVPCLFDHRPRPAHKTKIYKSDIPAERTAVTQTEIKYRDEHSRQRQSRNAYETDTVNDTMKCSVVFTLDITASPVISREDGFDI